MTPKLFLALGALALSAGAVATLAAGPDYTSLPPQPTAIAESLASAKTSLGDAVRIAQDHAKGLASEVRRGEASFEVDVYGREASATVSVSMTDGKVLSSTPITWLPGDEVVGEWITTDSGLKYAEIVEDELDIILLMSASPDFGDANRHP